MGYCSAAQSGSVRETWKTVEVNREPVEASESRESRQEAVEDITQWPKGFASHRVLVSSFLSGAFHKGQVSADTLTRHRRRLKASMTSLVA